jgi:hypothetical protein
MDEESSLLWLSAGYTYSETEGFAVTIQVKVIKTRNYCKHCLGVLSDQKIQKM